MACGLPKTDGCAGVRAFCAGIALMLWAGAAAPQGTVLEVIALRYRTAQELIPIVQPLLVREGTVSDFQGQLVVRTTPANLEEIKRVLAGVDVAPRRLLVTVSHHTTVVHRERSTEISGTIGADRARVTVPGSGERRGGSVVLSDGDDRLRGRAFEGAGTERGRGTQSVQVVEGREAFVSVGQSVPVRERQVRRTIVGGQVVEQVVESTHRDVETGFYVLPRLSGDKVMLEVSARREALSDRPRGRVDVQRAVTTLSGRLGEWLELGAVVQETDGRQAILLGAAAASRSDVRRVLVKVEELR